MCVENTAYVTDGHKRCEGDGHEGVREKRFIIEMLCGLKNPSVNKEIF